MSAPPEHADLLAAVADELMLVRQGIDGIEALVSDLVRRAPPEERSNALTQAQALYVPAQGPVPLALLTTSGSGLDPHLPPAAVAYQLARVAAARQLPLPTLQALVEQSTLHPLVGPPVVNILALNAALDQLAPASK